MKELTIEEKAKAYDELFAKAKTMMVENTNEVDGAKILTNLFPQLAESEDERIWLTKYLQKEIDCLRCDIRDYKDSAKLDNLQRALAWLKKQGTDISSFPEEQQVFMQKYVSLDKVTLIKLLAERDANNAEIIESFEKQGEPKEINPSEFDSQLNRLLGQFKSLPKEELANSLSFYLNVVQNDGTYKEEKPSEQKPAWSEEDKKMLDDIIEASTHHCYLNITDINWLKSLKDRVQPQPKQEWSKEDEYLLDETIKHLESLIRITEKQGSAYSDEIQYYQRDIDWLKSLRPQKWRPTEDQIMCLQDAISNYQHRGYKAETLESLCKQLKQL